MNIVILTWSGSVTASKREIEMAVQQVSLNLMRSKSEQEIRELIRHASRSQPFDLAIVAIGITGTGKSTLLNTLAGKEVFRAAGGVLGCTSKVQKEIVKFQSRTVALIDTPGLLDPEILDKALSQGAKNHVLFSQQSAEFEAYLEEALHEAGEKVDAFLLVFNAKNRWSLEAEWVIEVLNTLGIDYGHMIAVFTHGDCLGKTKAERYKQMKAQMDDPRAEVYKLNDLLKKIQFRWIITESNDNISSGNYEVWEEVTEKLKNVRVMLNEDYIEIQHKMKAEEEMGRIKNTTLKEIEQQESELCEMTELGKEIDRCEPERMELVLKLHEQVKKLSSDVPEAGFTADDDLASLSAKHDEMLLALQEKNDHLASLQSKNATMNEELGSRASAEATRSRQKQAQANEATLEKAREYWPQYMNGGEEHVAERDESDQGDQGNASEEEDASDSETETSVSPEADDGEGDRLLS